MTMAGNEKKSNKLNELKPDQLAVDYRGRDSQRQRQGAGGEKVAGTEWVFLPVAMGTAEKQSKSIRRCAQQAK